MIRLFLALLVLFAFSGISSAFEIQEIESQKGIKAWLVEAHDVPIVSIHFSFQAARDLQVVGKEGSIGLMANGLTEGAGSYSANEIKAKLDAMTSSYRFYAAADQTSGQLQTLSKNLSATADLLKASLETPRFEPASIERLRDEALQAIARARTDQNTIADDTWYALAFPNHLYGSPGRGTEQGLKATTVEDLQMLWKRIGNRRNMQIVVVGDITAANLKVLLDHVFGNLPDKDLVAAEEPSEIATGPIEKRIVYDNPQTVVTFGYPSTGGKGRDAWAAYLLTEIMGGRPGFARLNQTLREKSGLTYGVSMSYNDWEFGDIQYGSFSTATETTDRALQLLRNEFAQMAKNGPTAKELLKVKSFINGSYPLSFSDNNSIAAQLLHKKQRGYSPNYFKERASLVDAVTLEDVKAQAAKLLKPENQIVVVVGRK